MGVVTPHSPLDGLRRLDLDFDVNAGRKVEALQRINRLGRRLQDVDKPLVNFHLEVLAAVFVFVGTADHGVDVALCGERHRSTNFGLRADDRFDDLFRGLVDDFVIVCLEADTNLLFVLSHDQFPITSGF